MTLRLLLCGIGRSGAAGVANDSASESERVRGQSPLKTREVQLLLNFSSARDETRKYEIAIPHRSYFYPAKLT